MTVPSTPHTEAGVRIYDDLPGVDAAVAAWRNPGPRPDVHERARDEVRRLMPVLARALDRLAAERI